VTFRVLALTLTLAACRDDRPPAPTEQQSAELNEMDAALNDAAVEANKEGPEQRPGPSNSSE
jgi:type III secretory pathway lipoprotein EscJ